MFKIFEGQGVGDTAPEVRLGQPTVPVYGTGHGQEEADQNQGPVQPILHPLHLHPQIPIRLILVGAAVQPIQPQQQAVAQLLSSDEDTVIRSDQVPPLAVLR